MRCDEVIRELAAPAADRDRADLADHLAGCPACAEWARRAEGLDTLWEATRPAEPSPAAWDAVWANIAQALPSSSSVRHEDPPMVGAAPSRNGSGPKILVHPGPVPVSTPAPAPASPGPRTRGRGWRFAAVGLVGLAQAAAILIALGLAWQPHPVGAPKAPDIAQNTPRAPAAIRSDRPIEVDAEFEVSSLMVIHLDQKSSRVEDRTPPEMYTSADIGMEMTNAMESIATPQVAAR